MVWLSNTGVESLLEELEEESPVASEVVSLLISVEVLPLVSEDESKEVSLLIPVEVFSLVFEEESKEVSLGFGVTQEESNNAAANDSSVIFLNFMFVPFVKVYYVLIYKKTLKISFSLRICPYL